MKNYLKQAEITAVMLASVFIAIMAVAAADVYADTYYVDINENVRTTVRWGTTYDPEAVTYVKIKPSKKGIITFTTDFECFVSLCDSKYNVLSEGSGTGGSGDWLNPSGEDFQKKVYFGVKKGTTYNLKVKLMPNTTNSEGRYVGVLNYTNTKITPSKNGSSKKKAKAIKKNKTTKGLFVAGSKKPQWFKITTNQKVINISFNSAKTDYYLNFKVYYKLNGQNKSILATLGRPTEYNKDTATGTFSKKAKRTYYIKVYPEAKASGYYTIKWK